MAATEIALARRQRRYVRRGPDRLGFIRHARDLGFSLGAIQPLIGLPDHPDRSCKEATDIAVGQADKIQRKISQLQALKRELKRIAGACDGADAAGDCPTWLITPTARLNTRGRNANARALITQFPRMHFRG